MVMIRLFFLELLSMFFCFSACVNSNKQKGNSSVSLFKDCRIIIECPNYYSYYSIDFKNNDDEVVLGFCYEKNDTFNYTVGKQDSIVNVAVFKVSGDDKKKIDSLLVAALSMNKKNKQFAHDSFRYLLVMDGVIRIEDDTSNKEVRNILKRLLNYFPQNVESYDFCGFFKVFNDA